MTEDVSVNATRDVMAGFVLTMPYPFLRTVWEAFDPNGSGPELSWKPGCEHKMFMGYEDAIERTQAHGVGAVSYTVIDVYQPPRPYPKRVFYTRKWTDPDGRSFGKSNLRLTTYQAFQSWRSRDPMEKFGIDTIEDLDDETKRMMLQPYAPDVVG